ncbi:MAG: EAL domain-containing protein [Pseudomonadota bacterium]
MTNKPTYPASPLATKPFAPTLEGNALIDEALEAVRTHLNMPIAYLSRFEGDEMEFRNVSSPDVSTVVKKGDYFPLSEAYCSRIANGTLPNLIRDTADLPLCQEIDATQALPIRSHVSLPVTLDDGSLYGMFCCLSPEPNHSLNERDLAVMSAFANLATRQVRRENAQNRKDEENRAKIQDILTSERVTTVLQPIVRLSDNRMVGVEALSQFQTADETSTESVFEIAEAVGLDLDLELLALSRAIETLDRLDPDIYLSVNASPEFICDPRFTGQLPKNGLDRIVIEVTERSLAKDEATFQTQIANLHTIGARIAMDDVGVGYSGLQRITMVSPDIIKIDRSLITGLHESLNQRAMVAALVHFGRETDGLVVAEGVEHPEEVDVIKALGVDLVQGWHFGAPMDVGELPGHREPDKSSRLRR